jgi:hypothetical protein
MAELATIATIASTAAGVAQSVNQAQRQGSAEKAQSEALRAQAQARAAQRQDLLAKTIASTRARLSASGARADEGSGRALIEGMQKEAQEDQNADDQALAARLSAGRRSLLDSDGTLTGLTRAARSASSLGSGLRSLLDIF